MAQPCGHIVQLYGGDTALLLERAGRFLGEGLAQGEPGLIVATARHRDGLLRQLAVDGRRPTDAIRDGFLAMCDADEVLRAVLVDGAPDWTAFERELGRAVRGLRGRTGVTRIRVYGEMLGILWQAGRTGAALTLEEYWNRLLGEGTFSLLCSYPVGVLDQRLDADVPGPLRKQVPDRTDAIPERARRDPDSHRRAG